MRIRTRRLDRNVYFPDWKTYRLARSKGGDGSFCRFLDENLRDIRDDVSRYAVLLEDRNTPAAKRIAPLAKISAHDDLQPLTEPEWFVARWAYPWITPVLGTGCLDTSDENGRSVLAGRPDRLAAAASGWDLLADGDLPGALIKRFAAGLIHLKVSDPSPLAETAPESEGSTFDNELVARYVLVAALMSRLYNEAAALQDAPPATDHDVLEIDISDPLGAELIDRFVVRLRDELSELAATAGPVGQSFLATVLGDLSAGLHARCPRLRRLDATLLSEIAWHNLTRGTTHYAGWSDTLFDASLKSNRADRDMRWPQIEDPTDKPLLRWLREGLLKTTETSWKSRRSGVETTERDSLYDTVASLITAQAQRDKSSLTDYFDRHRQTAFPPGVAYVTSLDIELEMALLARPASTPFVMVVPFELIRQAATPEAQLVWLYSIVTREDHAATGDDFDVAHLMSVGEWQFLLPDSFADDFADAAGYPIVVRLTGSPLVSPPDVIPNIPDQILKLLDIPVREKYSLRNAVIVDEYTGLHHLSSDLRAYMDTTSTLQGLGLPSELVGNRGRSLTPRDRDLEAKAKDMQGGPPEPDNLDQRFWMLLGVQIGDSAIRQRLASLLNGTGVTAPEAFRTGVAVVRRSNPQDRDIFHWLGLDVVAADASEVAPALSHYTAHLAAFPYQRRMLDDVCPLGAEE